MQLDLDGIPITVLRKPIKNIYLRVFPPEGQVVVTAPENLSSFLIHDYLSKKKTWINEKRADMHSLQKKAPLSFTQGEIHHFFGQPYPLVVYENTEPMRMFLQDSQIHCFIKMNVSLDAKKELLSACYKREMQQLLPSLIKKWEPIIGVQVHHFGVKKMKSRWGSCNVKTKHIWLNLALAKLPLHCLEYVLVHELVHLLEASHNKRFYALMSHFFPQWEEVRAELRQVCLH